MDILVNLGAATLCFLGQCYPALVGNTTPTGTYQITHRYTSDPGYGGDVLKFKETPTSVFAIHRVWTLDPKGRRRARLRSINPNDRKGITGGCINIDEVVYEKLVSSCKYGCTVNIQL
jgi:hypothetical protein